MPGRSGPCYGPTRRAAKSGPTAGSWGYPCTWHAPLYTNCTSLSPAQKEFERRETHLPRLRQCLQRTGWTQAFGLCRYQVSVWEVRFKRHQRASEKSLAGYNSWNIVHPLDSSCTVHRLPPGAGRPCYQLSRALVWSFMAFRILQA